MVRIEGLRKVWGKRTVLDGLAFDVADGEIVALVAGNGAGKTTCFRAVAGGLSPDAGRILIDGRPQATDAGRIPVSYGTDGRATWPNLTPRQLLRMLAPLAGVPADRAKARVDAAIAAVGLDAVADRRQAQPSTGESRKLSLARLLLNPHRNVVLDEPTSGLDFVASEAVERIVRGLRRRGHCVLVSSHRIEEIARLADRVVLMADGRAVRVDTPEGFAAGSKDGTLRTALRDGHREARA